ncbi:hypothetical protein EDI_150880 [Entamoeba dispar SAW760]|uniref:Uncharacterized protein n=1 Tax=Entamoeba dispar (strain ATCC PRA-260 / SAW760) TaxID=370354 RepID=B0EQ51_ENTDS|nr:uncharacterized protein EDI_150880 [Entamoeba dispar SAW760]EDR23339.1 hypothetical protein EDI_150880 [Entamoeba dispar SAW760]|eukprot:EDR23339.1 hypothetical protein EDI_150880 [Entamoeba dispar SAW760]
MSKQQLNLLRQYPTYKKLYAMQEKIDQMENSKVHFNDICSNVDYFFEKGVIVQNVMQIEHPAEAAMKGSKNLDRPKLVLHDDVDLLWNSMKKGSTLELDEYQVSKKKDEDIYIKNDNFPQIDKEKVKEEVSKMTIPSTIHFNPHVLEVCHTFKQKIFTTNDLADAILSVLGH